ncbi:ABC transporter ATP-binding protein [Enterococcus sp. LJL98]
MIRLNQAQVIYSSKNEEVAAIEPIDLSIEKGEFICLVGPSGCGKSTLLKLMAGYLKPTSGEVRMQNEIIEGPDWKKGVVFQSPTLYPWLNVQQNIEYGLKMRKINKKERHAEVRYFLEQTSMTAAANRYPFELSGGMKQRVAMARTMVNHPELLLMDEPFGALDALTRMQMQALMRKLWQENHQTIFLITHDIEEALSLGTRVLVMSKAPGQLMESISVDYSQKALATEGNVVKMDEDFIRLKEEILQKIMQ